MTIQSAARRATNMIAHEREHPRVPVELTGTPTTCRHSRRPDARPDRCTQCLGIAATRIARRAIDDIVRHPWALARLGGDEDDGGE